MQSINGRLPRGWAHAIGAITLVCSLSACGGGGGSSSSTPPPPSAPTVSMSAPAGSIQIGASANLTWSTTNASSCALSGSGVGTSLTVPTSSTGYSVTPADGGADVYTLACSGAGGNASQTATLNVTPSVTINIQTNNSSGPTETAPVGTNTQLAWRTSAATSCTASGAWSGSQSTSSTEISISQPPGTYAYTLTCQNSAGSTAQTATLNVTPALSVSIGSQAGASVATAMLGQSTNLAWSTNDATACTYGGALSGTAPVTGTQSVSPTSVGKYTYTLTCSAAGQSITQSVMLTVTPALDLNVSPSTITPGQSATLTWTSTSAASCTAVEAWTGTVAVNGSMSVSPPMPGAYVFSLACPDAQGDYSFASIILTVAPNGFAPTSLVADSMSTSASARATDPNLINPWGIAFVSSLAYSGALSAVIANEQNDTSTSYDGAGAAGTTPFLVHLPKGAGATAFNPTGVVSNTLGSGFAANNGAGKSAPGQVIYVGESGMIASWAAAVDASNAYTVYTDTGGAEYTGATLANGYLYAADFHNNKIDVFDSTFTKQTPTAGSFAFTDATLPAGYAPYGIQAIGSGSQALIYVAYAQQVGPANRTAAAGAGLGMVDVYDVNGVFKTHLIATGGALNAPWQIALAQPVALDLGSTLTGTVLVGNSGDGTINAFNTTSGALVGTISDANGTPIAVPGLKGFALGDNFNNQAGTALFYTAGPNAGTSGLYGRIDYGAAPRLHTPPAVTVTGGNLGPSLGVSVAVTDSVGIAWVEFYGQDCTRAVTNVLPYSTTCARAATGQPVPASAVDVDGNVSSGVIANP